MSNTLPNGQFMSNTLPNGQFMSNTLPNGQFMSNTIPNEQFMSNTLPNGQFMSNTLPNRHLMSNTLPNRHFLSNAHFQISPAFQKVKQRERIINNRYVISTHCLNMSTECGRNVSLNTAIWKTNTIRGFSCFQEIHFVQLSIKKKESDKLNKR
jgi:hypothetical protein